MQSHDTKKTIRHILSLGLTFLLMLCILTALLLLGCRIGLLNEKVILWAVDKTGYWQGVYDTIHNDASEILLPIGLPGEVLNDVFSMEEVHGDVEKAMSMSFKGQEYQPDMQAAEERFQENVQAFITEQKMKTNKETENGIKQIFEEIEQQYNTCLQFPFAKYFVQYQTKFNKIFLPVFVLFICVIVGICVALIRMHYWRHRGVRYIVYATLGAAWMLGIPTIILLVTQVYRHINLSPEYLYNLLVGVIHIDLILFLIFTCGLLLVSGAGIWIVSRMREAKKDKMNTSLSVMVMCSSYFFRRMA